MELIISGGQTGADLAGIEWAILNKIPNTIHTFIGFQPVGVPRTINYHTVFMVAPNGSYASKLRYRTQFNVEKADGTLIFIDKALHSSKGSLLTVNLCKEHNKPYRIVHLNAYTDLDTRPASDVMKSSKVLNIAGSRSCDEEKVRELLEEINGYR